METTIVERGYMRFRPVMENQMENNMEMTWKP